MIGTEASALAILDYHRHNPGRDDLRDVLENVRDYLVEMHFIRDFGASFFMYKTTLPRYRANYNASIIAAAYVSEFNRYAGQTRGDDFVHEAVGFVVERQHDDGCWFYSIDLRTGKEKNQVDYHQGYILEALRVFCERFGFDGPAGDAYRKGLAFYRDVQFLPSGESYYRYPTRWPTDIHNQAQGILTFTRAAHHYPEYREVADRIVRWTIDNMQDGEGYFYYQRYPLVMNRIPYMRWGQATMLNALASYLFLEPASPDPREA